MEIFLTKKAEEILAANEMTSLCSYNQKWSLNTFLVDRKKSLIITHKETLYTFFIFCLTKDDIKQQNKIVLTSLQNQLTNDNISVDNALKYFDISSENQICFFKTDNDQKTLGWMRDIMMVVKSVMNKEKSDRLKRINDFARYINKRPIGSRGYKNSIEVLTEKMNENCT